MKIRALILSAIFSLIATSTFAESSFPASPKSHSAIYSDGKIKELKIVENGTDLIVTFEDGRDWNVHVPTKLDSNVWKINRIVYMDKRSGHLYLMELQDYM
ncbi:hypothetical protein [Burkholderia cepacia]|uniref:hypothetical protein n=1 Tax=Burkholderia cepacia TaxID=292 RepID=UPI00158D5A64|nr:hypothetical protein [Burkholderia cepacia]